MATFSRRDVDNTPFSIIIKEDDGTCNITIGNELVCKHEFSNEEAAKQYITDKPWDLIFNAVFSMVNFINQQNQNQEVCKKH